MGALEILLTLLKNLARSESRFLAIHADFIRGQIPPPPYTWTVNGSQVRLISTRSWVRGGVVQPPCCSQNYWSDYRKNCQGVRKRYFIDTYAILSQLKHFCGNGSKLNFRLRVLIPGVPIKTHQLQFFVISLFFYLMSKYYY